MSKPDSYMPFYGLDFTAAMRGQPDAVVVGYLNSIVYYWFHNSCAGLKDDSEFLRKVCEREREDWEMVKGVIFDNNEYWRINPETGLWEQRRAKELWIVALAGYKRASQAGKLGAKARWKIVPPVRRS